MRKEVVLSSSHQDIGELGAWLCEVGGWEGSSSESVMGR